MTGFELKFSVPRNWLGEIFFMGVRSYSKRGVQKPFQELTNFMNCGYVLLTLKSSVMTMNFRSLLVKITTWILFGQLKRLMKWFCFGGNGIVVYQEEWLEICICYFLLALEFFYHLSILLSDCLSIKLRKDSCFWGFFNIMQTGTFWASEDTFR